MDKTPPSGRVRRRHELNEEVQPYKREPLDHEAYQTRLSSIHTDAVTGANNNYSMNAVLRVHPHPLQPKNIGCIDKPG